eukprot:359174-Prorocentrum_minimum.AAC.1
MPVQQCTVVGKDGKKRIVAQRIGGDNGFAAGNVASIGGTVFTNGGAAPTPPDTTAGAAGGAKRHITPEAMQPAAKRMTP